jgi:hypothetical protein
VVEAGASTYGRGERGGVGGGLIGTAMTDSPVDSIGIVRRTDTPTREAVVSSTRTS